MLFIFTAQLEEFEGHVTTPSAIVPPSVRDEVSVGSKHELLIASVSFAKPY